MSVEFLLTSELIICALFVLYVILENMSLAHISLNKEVKNVKESY